MKYERLGNLFIPKNIIRGGLGKYIEAGVDLPPVRLKGRFKVELLDRQGRVKQKLEFDNLITNAALDAMATNVTVAGLRTYAAVGTGSTTPTGADTSLVSEITPASSNRTSANGGVTETNTYVSGTPDYWQRVTTYLFDFTQGNGNLTEIGLFSASSSGTMWTRQLLKDSGGIATTVTKTSSDQLRITYTLQTYPPQTDGTATVTISTVSYTVTSRPQSVSGSSVWGAFTGSAGSPGQQSGSAAQTWTGTIAARTSAPTGTSNNDSSRTIATYVAGNHYLDVTSIWNAASGNSNVNTVVCFGTTFNIASIALMQLGFSPALPKTSTKQLTLVIRNSWGLYP